MSILIKGMEMPKNCFLCPLSVLQGERLFCEQTKGEVVRAKIDSDCPLVEIPPHGRLIDADALTEGLLEHLDALDGLDRSEMAQRDGLSCAIGDVANAPTIIESEGEDESR